MKCDLCNEPWVGRGWTYETPSTATSAADAIDGRVWVEDEGWLVCDPCHLLIEAGDEAGLLSRSIRVQRGQNIILGGDAASLQRLMEAEVARMHGLFWQLKSPYPPVQEPGFRA